jgi:hypothetical protein
LKDSYYTSREKISCVIFQKTNYGTSSNPWLSW